MERLQMNGIQCIYAIINTVSQRVYVGSTKDFYVRVDGHRKDLNKTKHHCRYLQYAWNKYGEDKFVFGILELVYNQSLLLATEQFYLDSLPNLYNDNLKAEKPPVQYGPRPASFGLKISLATKGIPRPQTRGRKQSPEHVEAVAASNRGKKRSPEICQRIRDLKMGVPMHPSTKDSLRKRSHRPIPFKVGDVFEELTVKEITDVKLKDFGSRSFKVVCLCSCGNTISFQDPSRSKMPKSCGCVKAVVLRNFMLKAQGIRAQQQRELRERSRGV